MIRWPSFTVAARGKRDSENGSYSNAAIATITREYNDCLLMTPTDRTFTLLLNKGDLDCVMCSLDQIKMRMNMYRDDVWRVLRIGDLDDEDVDSDNN